MGTYDDGYDDDYSDDNGGPRALREALKRANAEKEKQAKELTKLQEAFATLQAGQRESTLQSAITAKGLNPKVARLVPKDIDADALDGWLDDYAEVFGGAGQSKAAEEDAAVQQAKVPLQEEADPEEAALAAAWSTLREASQGQAPVHVDDLLASELDRVATSSSSYQDAVKALSAVPGFRVADHIS